MAQTISIYNKYTGVTRTETVKSNDPAPYVAPSNNKSVSNPSSSRVIYEDIKTPQGGVIGSRPVTIIDSNAQGEVSVKDVKTGSTKRYRGDSGIQSSDVSLPSQNIKSYAEQQRILTEAKQARTSDGRKIDLQVNPNTAFQGSLTDYLAQNKAPATYKQLEDDNRAFKITPETTPQQFQQQRDKVLGGYKFDLAAQMTDPEAKQEVFVRKEGVFEDMSRGLMSIDASTTPQQFKEMRDVALKQGSGGVVNVRVDRRGLNNAMFSVDTSKEGMVNLPPSEEQRKQGIVSIEAQYKQTKSPFLSEYIMPNYKLPMGSQMINVQSKDITQSYKQDVTAEFSNLAFQMKKQSGSYSPEVQKYKQSERITDLLGIQVYDTKYGGKVLFFKKDLYEQPTETELGNFMLGSGKKGNEMMSLLGKETGNIVYQGLSNKGAPRPVAKVGERLVSMTVENPVLTIGGLRMGKSAIDLGTQTINKYTGTGLKSLATKTAAVGGLSYYESTFYKDLPAGERFGATVLSLGIQGAAIEGIGNTKFGVQSKFVKPDVNVIDIIGTPTGGKGGSGGGSGSGYAYAEKYSLDSTATSFKNTFGLAPKYVSQGTYQATFINVPKNNNMFGNEIGIGKKYEEIGIGEGFRTPMEIPIKGSLGFEEVSLPEKYNYPSSTVLDYKNRNEFSNENKNTFETPTKNVFGKVDETVFMPRYISEEGYKYNNPNLNINKNVNEFGYPYRTNFNNEYEYPFVNDYGYKFDWGIPSIPIKGGGAFFPPAWGQASGGNWGWGSKPKGSKTQYTASLEASMLGITSTKETKNTFGLRPIVVEGRPKKTKKFKKKDINKMFSIF